MLVEGHRGLVDGVHDHQSCGGDVTGLHGSAQGIQQQLATEPLPMQGPIEGQSGEQHRRNGVWCAACDLSGKLRTDDEMGGEAEVGDHEIVSGMPDEGSCGAHGLGVASMPLEPDIERITA